MSVSPTPTVDRQCASDGLSAAQQVGYFYFKDWPEVI